MTTSAPFDATSDAITRIEGAWADIVDRHPDVEAEVVFVVKSDRRAWGHMTLGRTWQEDLPEGCEGPRRTWREIMLSAELLAQHPARILQTMIHEAAHTVAQTRGVQDTSRQYRYHNGTFRSIAEEMGLEWTHVEAETVKVPGHKGRYLLVDEDDQHLDEDGDFLFPVEAGPDSTIGFSDMHVSAETIEAYADTLANLDGIKVKHHADRRAAAAPRKRATVCLVPDGAVDGATEVVSEAEALDFFGLAAWPVAEDPVQRIGPVVYKGLVERNLLAGHLFWIESV